MAPFLYDITWEDVSLLDKENVVVIFPIGSCEQHSLHLPLGMDTYSVIHMANDLAKYFGDKIIVLPPLWYGASEHHMDFPGTITLSHETLIAIIHDVISSLLKHGFRKIVILNGHGGNTDPIRIALRKIRYNQGVIVELINPWMLIEDKIKSLLESDVWGHACEFETSEALYIIPDKVKVNKIRDPKLNIELWKKLRNRNIPWHTKDISDTGSLGYPTKASKDKGKKLYEFMLKATIDVINDILH